MFQSIVDVFALPPRTQQARRPQRHEMLRYVRLPFAEQSLQVAHAGFALPEDGQDPQPEGLVNGPEQMADLEGAFG